MALNLTERQRLASQEQVKKPNIVLEFEGLSTLYGAVPIRREVRIGDPGLIIGEPSVDPNAFYIGEFRELLDQKKIIDLNATTKSIRQTLNQDLAEGSSISSFKIALIDDGSLADLLTPGVLLDDVLGTKCRVWYTLNAENTSYPEDYVPIFKGIVTEVDTDAGKVIMSINSPQNKLKAKIFKTVDTESTLAIAPGDTVIEVEDTENFLVPITAPGGGIDSAFESYAVIDDLEIIRYTGKTATQLTGVSRGQFNTPITSHDSGVQVTSRYRLKGNVMDLALKLLSSGIGEDFATDVPLRSFEYINPSLTVSNAIYFKDLTFLVKYGLTVGDYVSTTGADNPANDITDRQIIDIVSETNGFYLIVDGAGLVSETNSPATASFRSQYDSLPDGFRLTPDEIETEAFRRLFDLFLNSFEYDFLLKETVEGKEWYEKQILSPVACYSIPRSSQVVSIGYHIGPIPGQDIKTFSNQNVLDPSGIRVKRSSSRYFYNEVVYQYDPAVIEDKFTRGFIAISEDSKNQIKGSAKTLTISSLGMRDVLQGKNIAQSQSLRRLERYQFAAERVDIKTTFGDGFAVEIGDIVIFDGEDLEVIDIKQGKRGMEARLFEVQNKQISLNGTVSLSLVDTSFDGSLRRGLISPSSVIKSGISTTRFLIQQSFSSRFASDEYRKWINLNNPAVRIRNNDFSIDEFTTITDVTFNTITVSPALSFTPTPGLVMEFAPYNDPNTTAQQKLIYGYMNDTVFDDGGEQYTML